MDQKQSVFTVIHESEQTSFEKLGTYNMIGNKRNQTSLDNPLNTYLAKSQNNKQLPEANPVFS